MTTQQEFLREAMVELGLKREDFALRLACPKRTLDKWLLPSASKDHRAMDEAMWKFVREVLEHERLKIAHAKAHQKVENSC
jgi:hypothetical protein